MEYSILYNKKFELAKRASILFVLMVFWIDSLAQDRKIVGSIKVPAGYGREIFPEGSYSDWIQNLTLKEDNIILDFEGDTISPWCFYKVLAVIDMPLLFRADLEQCADYCMRFWAEYHRSMDKLDSLYLFDYGGNRKKFKDSGKTYRDFLRWSFSYSNSYSLKNGCKGIDSVNLVPGDMIVQNERGGIGHVSVILDVCKSEGGDKLYLIGYSFMPAQEFHIEKAGESRGIDGWFTLQGYFDYLSEILPLGEPVLRRFEP